MARVLLGRYTLLAPIGQGGMGAVFLARQTGPGSFARRVVVKCIQPSSTSSSQTSRQAILREAQIMAQLSHPNIVQIFDVGEQDGVPFLVMEHIAGCTLSALLEAAEAALLSLPQVLTLGIDICRGLHYLHTFVDETGESLGLVHRDIKPSNVMITRDGQVKLIDFGIAKMRVPAQEATVTGELKGTFPYMSPEQAQGQRIDRRSDIFSLGVVLSCALTGHHPFHAASVYKTLEAIIHLEVPPLSLQRSDAPPRLELALERCLAKDAADRFATAAELQEQLQCCLDELRQPEDDDPHQALAAAAVRRSSPPPSVSESSDTISVELSAAERSWQQTAAQSPLGKISPLTATSGFNSQPLPPTGEHASGESSIEPGLDIIADRVQPSGAPGNRSKWRWSLAGGGLIASLSLAASLFFWLWPLQPSAPDDPPAARDQQVPRRVYLAEGLILQRQPSDAAVPDTAAASQQITRVPTTARRRPRVERRAKPPAPALPAGEGKPAADPTDPAGTTRQVQPRGALRVTTVPRTVVSTAGQEFASGQRARLSEKGTIQVGDEAAPLRLTLQYGHQGDRLRITLTSDAPAIAYTADKRPHRLPWHQVALGTALQRFEIRRTDGKELTLLLKHFPAAMP